MFDNVTSEGVSAFIAGWVLFCMFCWQALKFIDGWKVIFVLCMLCLQSACVFTFWMMNNQISSVMIMITPWVFVATTYLMLRRPDAILVRSEEE